MSTCSVCGAIRDDLGDQLRAQPARVQHLVRLVGVHGHAGLGQHVLPGFQRRQHQVTVHVRPRADADRVYGIVVQQVNPVVIDLGDFVLPRDALAGFAAPVGHRHDFHVALFAEPGNVAQPRVGSGPDQADADHSVHHRKGSFECGVSPILSRGISRHSG